jgi:hypothetical protein
MFRSLFLYIALSFSLIPLWSFGAEPLKVLDSLESFLETNRYRQVHELKTLRSFLGQTHVKDKKLQAVRDFYIKIKSNQKFKPKVKQYILKEMTSFYKSFKKINDKKALAVTKLLVEPVKLRPIRIDADPIIRVPATDQLAIWKKNLLVVNVMVLGLLTSVIVILFRKNILLKEAGVTSVSLDTNTKAPKVLDHSILNTLLKVSTGILPQNSYILYDFQGKVTKFSANIKQLVAGKIYTGMPWSHVLDRHFHKIGEGESSYYISLHNTEKFFSMSTKSIDALGVNICQFVEVDKDIVTKSKDYLDQYYLDKPCSLVDLFENALVDASSFRDFNLVDNIIVESIGNDISFQSEKDIEKLFQSMAKVIRYVHEDEAPASKVKFDTFQEKHIVNFEFFNYEFSSLEDPRMKNFLERVEDVKDSLENLAGSIVVKNIKGSSNRAVIQVIFDQVLKRDLCIEEEFELQQL